VESSNPRSSHIPARTSKAHRSPAEASAATAILFNTVVGAPRSGVLMASPGVKARRLVADQKYFGLEAGLFRTGAGRALARLSGQPPERARIDTHSLGHDFLLDSAASAALLSELLAGGMLYPDGMGRYRPTRLFREYALASVVAPLQRERAKALLDRACALAATINSDWDQVPFRIAMMAVSGSYMTRRDQLPELSLSLGFCRRPEAPAPRPAPSLSRDDGLRQVVDAMRTLSSFIVVRVVIDRKAVQRPFSVVFEVGENVADSSVAGWDRFRDWSASVTRWLAVK
jgi:hypothetical protein